MKSKGFFSGALFVTLGVLFLLRQFDTELPKFDMLYDWWPVLLVLFGISLMKLHDGVKAALSLAAGAFGGILIFSLITRDWVDDIFDDADCEVYFNDSTGADNYYRKEFLDFSNSNSHTFSEDIKTARLSVEAGAGSFYIGDVSENQLIEVSSRRNISNLYVNKNDSSAYVNLEMALSDHGKIKKNKCGVSLNPNPVWDMNIETGASKMVCDFSKYKVRNLDIEAGATGIDIRLGALLDSSTVDIEIGAAKVRILIPRESGCLIDVEDAAFNSYAFEDFSESSAGEFVSSNYETSDKKIFIRFNGGLAKFKVERY